MDTPMGNEVVERVKADPTPQGKTWRCRVARFMAWGRARRLIVNFRALDRAAAMDSVRNVLAVIGVGTVLADFGTMKLWMAVPCMAVAFLGWYGDYLRHF
jgi:hypothetical protein